MKPLYACMAAVVMALAVAPEATAGDKLGKYALPSDYKDAQYGLHPALRKLFHIRRAPPAPAAYPMATGGTLVFPQHQYIRSPRDYFMVD
jgi:hypothetical protein